MSKRINELTDAQRALMPAWVEKWTAIGRQTGEVDWDRAESGLRVAYEKAGISWPKAGIIRVKSPLVGGLAAAYAEAILRSGAVNGAVHDAVYDAVNDLSLIHI